MHRLLSRQLKKLGLDAGSSTITSEQWRALLDTVSRTYDEADQDRYTLERSLTVSSEEMQSLYQRLKQSSEARLRAITSALPDILFLQDEEGRYLEVFADGTESKLVRPADEIRGKVMADIFPEPQSSRFMQAIQDALDQEGLQVLEYELQVAGREHWFEARVVPTDLRVEGLRTAAVLVRDITDRKQLEAHSRLIGTVYEAANEGVVVMDGERNVLLVNPAFSSMTGSKPAQVIGKRPTFLDAESKERVDTIWQTVAHEGGWMGEITGQRGDGSGIPMWLTLDAVQDETGRAIHHVALLTDVSEARRSREELEYVATHDPLTGLPNRGLFRDRLEQALARARRSDRPGALLFLDLDRFKVINDNLGHQVGDILLKELAQRLAAECRQEDTLARFGGDEFTLLLENLDRPQDAGIIAEKMLDALLWPVRLEDFDFEVSASIGISIFPHDGTDVDQLIRQADMAMYQAKETGRNRYRFFTRELTDHASRRFALEVDMRRAIAAGELFLEYQPQYRLDTGRLVGVEALVRWKHPDRGLIFPDDFIPVAEVTGIIEQLGEWVLTTCCNQIRLWDQQGLPPIQVAVNLSRRQLINPWLARSVAHILHEKGVQGERLELEITESAILDQEEVAYQNLKALHDMGISLSIDDFGTGYSSMKNLKRFPLNRLKIDRSFAQDLGHDSNDEAIIRATIALADSLQLRVVAEGVETREQQDFLRAEGCHEVQGFFFSRPVDADRVGFLLSVPRGGGAVSVH